MHKDLGSEIWMHRPLSPQLLLYAAMDIKMIAILYHHFRRVRWLSSPHLLDQCRRYVSLHQERGRVERGNHYRSNGFLPLDILDDLSEARVPCSGCRRELSRQHYMGREKEIGHKCRVCTVVDLKLIADEEKARKKKRTRG
jgi:exonuclease 3'-5' domain-containing protein 1